MEGMRRHTEKMTLAESLKTVGKGGKIVISGKSGKEMLDYFSDTLNLVSSR